MEKDEPSLLVVSHAGTIGANQTVYSELQRLGWRLTLVVPSLWRHDYSSKAFRPEALPNQVGRMVSLPVMGRGKPQRHVYIARIRRLCERLRPTVAFVEEEAFCLSAWQWASVLTGLGVLFGVQAAENMNRPFEWQ